MKKIQLSVPNLSLDILDNVRETIQTGWVSTGGRFIKEFEENLAAYVGVKNAVATQSGTAGLHLSLLALGVKPNDEIIVPTVTFIAAVNPVIYVNASPIFMDCDDTLNVDLDKVEKFLENECEIINNQTINKKTKRVVRGMIVVHVFGNPVDMERVMSLKKKFKLFILEDATEALGSFYTKGKYEGMHCGTIGDIGVYSFNANKIITTGGGGMVVSHNQTYLDKVSFLGVQAKTDSLYFVHDEIGFNYRMTNIQAAFGVSQLKQLDDFIRTKKDNYRIYKKHISNIKGLELLNFNDYANSNHWFYSLSVENDIFSMNRDELLIFLESKNIITRPLWKLIHTQKPYLSFEAYEIEKAYKYVDRILNIPCSSNLTIEDVNYINRVLEGIE